MVVLDWMMLATTGARDLIGTLGTGLRKLAVLCAGWILILFGLTATSVEKDLAKDEIPNPIIKKIRLMYFLTVRFFRLLNVLICNR
jgi:hypothetical protein